MNQEERNGNCFEVAARIVTGITGHSEDSNVNRDVERGLGFVEAAKEGLSILGKLTDIKLMHGVVERPTDKLLHLHGWVELHFGKNVMVLDCANGREWWGRVSDYYNHGVMMTTDYSVEDTMKNLAEHETWGPWHLKEPDEANARRRELREQQANG